MARFIAPVVCVVLAGAAACAATAAANGPTVRFQSLSPVRAAGSGFAARERVVVTLSGRPAMSVRIRTDSKGRFNVAFPPGALARCGGLRLLAVGRHGAKASATFPLPACLPERLP